MAMRRGPQGPRGGGGGQQPPQGGGGNQPAQPAPQPINWAIEEQNLYDAVGDLIEIPDRIRNHQSVRMRAIMTLAFVESVVGGGGNPITDANFHERMDAACYRLAFYEPEEDDHDQGTGQPAAPPPAPPPPRGGGNQPARKPQEKKGPSWWERFTGHKSS